MAVLVDSNVLLDVLTEDPRWFAWSSAALAREAEDDVVAINPIIYAEVSIGFERSKISTPRCLRRWCNACRCRGRQRFWRGSASLRIGGWVVPGRHRYRTSTSGCARACLV
jgi:hypothetical protein